MHKDKTFNENNFSKKMDNLLFINNNDGFKNNNIRFRRARNNSESRLKSKKEIRNKKRKK